MTEPRAVRVGKVWKRLLLDPRGTLTEEGRAVMQDLAKFCYIGDPVCIKDLHGRIDPLATQHALGRQEVYLRIAGMLALDNIQGVRLAHEMQRPTGDEVDTEFPG